MKDGHESTQVEWRRDVGAIGKSWRTRRWQYVDLRLLWGASQMDEASWGTLAQADRLGFKYSQYQAIQEKYATVLVAPIFENPDEAGSRFIGCIVVDSLNDYPADLNIRMIRNNVFRLSRDISQALAVLN